VERCVGRLSAAAVTCRCHSTNHQQQQRLQRLFADSGSIACDNVSATEWACNLDVQPVKIEVVPL